jgi:tRNA modification GTPase
LNSLPFIVPPGDSDFAAILRSSEARIHLLKPRGAKLLKSVAMSDTIFALASAAGRAGVAVVRISGPGAGAALKDLAGVLPAPREVRHVRFRAAQTGELIDDGLALFFPAPGSMTGEDVAEFQLHGSRAVLSAVFAELGARPGFRLAAPGEFTRRAFLNGKLDLTAAEGIADLVAAETTAQRRQALRQLAGEFGALCEQWRKRLIRAQAQLEAEIDFPEEGLPVELWEAARHEIKLLYIEIAEFLADNHRGERLREGAAIAILGPPNSGKSSLMNSLARRDVAITSSVAGTTRDVIEVALDLGGYPVVVADTAGLRATDDAIEEEGVRRARARAEAADLRLFVFDISRPEDAALLGPERDQKTLLILNKIDLGAEAYGHWVARYGAANLMPVSVLTGEGITTLVMRITGLVAGMLAAGETAVVTRARHRLALEAGLAALDRFALASLPELAAEELRSAAQALGRITGRVDVEDMLDALFREFCIGK